MHRGAVTCLRALRVRRACCVRAASVRDARTHGAARMHMCALPLSRPAEPEKRKEWRGVILLLGTDPCWGNTFYKPEGAFLLSEKIEVAFCASPESKRKQIAFQFLITQN